MKTILLMLVSLCFVSTISAQEFGKNKVHYKDFKWSYIKSQHFDVYYNKGGYKLAEFVAVEAEHALSSIEASLHYHIFKRIQLAVFNSGNDFQQNNIIPEYIGEGTGGVTTLDKNRIVYPWQGDLSLLRHVIHHELVHGTFNEMFYGGSIQSVIENNITFELPLWFNEGMAQYQSRDDWDVHADQFVMDATINGYMPPIPYLNGYLVYPGGQSVWRYITHTYGSQMIGEVVHAVLATHSLNEGFERSIGMNLDQLSDAWQRWNRKQYFPEVAEREPLVKFSQRMTNHEVDGSNYNTSPVISPDGSKIAFITDKSGYFDVVLFSTITDKKIMTLVKGERSANFEQLKILTPGIAWTPNGKYVAVVSKTGEYDQIFMINATTGAHYPLPDLKFDGINGIDFSPNGKYLAMSAYKPLQSDIYVYNMETHKTRNLTNDIFSDEDPHWSVNGKDIYFASDRGDSLYQHGNSLALAHWAAGNPLDIYSINVGTGKISRITHTDFPNVPWVVPHGGDNNYPLPTPDGKGLIFQSNRNGIANLYYHDFATGKSWPLTNSLYGVNEPSVSADGQRLAFASLNNGGYDVFTMNLPLINKIKEPLKPTKYVERYLSKVHRIKFAAKSDSSSSDTSADSSSINQSIASLYGISGNADLTHYVFNEDYQLSLAKKPTAPIFLAKAAVDSAGDYVPFPYIINFKPDVITGGAGFSTLYGFQGATELAFSDQLGNDEIDLYTDFVIDLRNSDYAVSYQNYASRVNFGLGFVHTANFLYIYNNASGNYDLDRFESYIGQLSFSRPFDRFHRLDLNMAYLGITEQNIYNSAVPSSSANAILLSLDYVKDNTLTGFFAPTNGSRYQLTLSYVPKVAPSFVGFLTGQFDYRTYLPFLDENVFAFRVSGASSVGPNPQKFFMGGVSSWINRSYVYQTIPITSVADYAFLTPVFPLRGFNYDAQLGTNYYLVNAEVRFPLVQYFVPGLLPILLSNIEGVLFVDAGSAFDSFSSYKPFMRDAAGGTVTQDLLIGSGFGARVPFLYFILRFDYGWQYNIEGFHSPIFYFSLGGDF